MESKSENPIFQESFIQSNYGKQPWVLTTMSTYPYLRAHHKLETSRYSLLHELVLLRFQPSCFSFSTIESNRLIFLLGEDHCQTWKLVSILRSLYLCRPLTSLLQDAEYLAIIKASKTWLVILHVSRNRLKDLQQWRQLETAG